MDELIQTFKEAIGSLRQIGDYSTRVSEEACISIFDAYRPVFQIFNQEFVDALAEYLIGSGLVLEVGAGNGVLSKELKERGVDILATDNGSWDIETEAEVERLDYEEAIQKYQPTIILSCWMPYEADWTPAFRKAGCVQEYILVGETDGGCCGSDDTWEEHPGFEREMLTEPSHYAICHTDYFVDDQLSRHSSVQAFHRTKTKERLAPYL